MRPTEVTQPIDDDAVLLRRFVSGDVASLGRLAEKYEAWLLSLARALTKDQSLAHDAVQETWMRVIRYADGFAGRSSVKTWVYRILVNRCIDMRNERASLKEEQRLDAGQALHPSSHSHQSIDPQLERALDKLDEQSRVLLLLHYHKGLTHDEVAIVFDVPLGTIKSRLHSALARLREHLSTSQENQP